MTASTAAGAPLATADRERIGANILRVVWLSIGLGIVIQGLILASMLLRGQEPGLGRTLADTGRSITWATLVCGGVAFGRALSGLRVQGMGLAGLIAAPVAFNVAKAVQKGLAEGLKLAPAAAAAAAGPSPALMTLVKALEYGALGALIGWISRQSWGDLRAHIGMGLAVGLIFGGLVYYLNGPGAGQVVPVDKAITIFINESVFPVGCAMVLFSTDLLKRRLAAGIA